MTSAAADAAVPPASDTLNARLARDGIGALRGFQVLDAWGRRPAAAHFLASFIGLAVEGQQPSRRVLPISSGKLIPVGFGATITARTQIAFRPERFLIAKPEGWVINDIRIGRKSVVAPGAGDLPGEMFNPQQMDPYFAMPTVNAGVDIEVDVTNVGAGDWTALALSLGGERVWLSDAVRGWMTEGEAMHGLDSDAERALVAMTELDARRVLMFYVEGEIAPHTKLGAGGRMPPPYERVYAIDEGTGSFVFDMPHGQPPRFDLSGLYLARMSKLGSMLTSMDNPAAVTEIEAAFDRIGKVARAARAIKIATIGIQHAPGNHYVVRSDGVWLASAAAGERPSRVKMASSRWFNERAKLLCPFPRQVHSAFLRRYSLFVDADGDVSARRRVRQPLPK